MKIYCIISCLFWTIFCYSQMHDKVELHSTDKAKVVIICTAALIESNYQMRKQEYVFSISLLKDYGYEPYVFEACKSSPPSFFENYTKNVFYSNVNDYRLINKGVNEARSLIEGFKHYSFDDETMIIKLTGRYWLNSPIFINVVESHPEVDAFVRFKEDFPIPNGYVFTGCFAMKHKHFKAMLDQLDFVRMEEKLIDIEIEAAHYIRKMEERGCTIMKLENVDMTANIGSAFPPIYSKW